MKNQDTQNNNDKNVNLSRRKLAKLSLISAPVLMSLHSRPVLSRTCTLSGMISGNMSVDAGGDLCDRKEYSFGRSPGYWKSLRHSSEPVDRYFTEFGTIFGTVKFDNLNFFEIFKLSEDLKNNCDAFKFRNTNKYRVNFCGDPDADPTGSGDPSLDPNSYYETTLKPIITPYFQADFELARFAAACYLNAMVSLAGTNSDIQAGYFFKPEQVIELYQLGEMGGGNYTVAGVTVYLTTPEIIQLLKDSFV